MNTPIRRRSLHGMCCAAIATLVAAFSIAAHADAIDPCSLLSDGEMAELGLTKGAAPRREAQPGGVQACKYDMGPAGGTVTIIVSQGVPERVLQLRAMQAKVRGESSPEQQQARGEYFEGGVMCKVVAMGNQESSQCIDASERSVVALTMSRPEQGGKLAYPAAQLRITAALVSRVMSRGD